MLFEESEPGLQVFCGEPLPEVTQDVVGVITFSAEPTELHLECVGLEDHCVLLSGRRKGRCRVEVNVARARDRPLPEPDG